MHPTRRIIADRRIQMSENNHQENDNKTVLSIRDLEVSFRVKDAVNRVIRGCSLDLNRGEILAIVGESGSGKSVICKSFVGMLDSNGEISGGRILLDGENITDYKTEKEWQKIRGRRIAMVMQDPMTSLNPLLPVGKQIREAVERHRGMKGEEAYRETLSLLEKVGIRSPERRYKQYPHELSGGQRQRVVIAIACACRPEILICDEPTTALDVTIQNQILDLIRKMKEELGMTVIIITHDLGVVANVAQRVAVMYAGQFVEIGMKEEIFYDAWHPYTWALLQAIPQLGKKGEELPTIEGTPPNRYQKIKGDAFAPRNKMALAIDFEEEPPWFSLSPTHKAKTWLLDPRMPAFERPEHVTAFHEHLEQVYGK